MTFNKTENDTANRCLFLQLQRDMNYFHGDHVKFTVKLLTAESCSNLPGMQLWEYCHVFYIYDTMPGTSPLWDNGVGIDILKVVQRKW